MEPKCLFLAHANRVAELNVLVRNCLLILAFKQEESTISQRLWIKLPNVAVLTSNFNINNVRSGVQEEVQITQLIIEFVTNAMNTYPLGRPKCRQYRAKNIEA